jgi:sugar phosphate isomerase/epimerase
VGNPNVKLYFDTQNYYFFYKLYTPDLIPALMPYICEVHVKDGRRDDLSPAGALLGEGDSDFFATIEALKKHNYQGWLVSENFYDHGPISSIAEDSVELMRRDLKTLQELF